jgi:hypothetical protein
MTEQEYKSKLEELEKDYLNKKLYPIDFKDNYKKKGLKLSFNFTYSKAMSPENCSLDGVIVLNNIDVIP